MFLKNIKLSGYKSIENIDINLTDGLNIIIGKNAAGKTNFFNFLKNILNFDYDGLSNFSSEILIETSSEPIENVIIKSHKQITVEDITNVDLLNSKQETEIIYQDKVTLLSKETKGIHEILNSFNIAFRPLFISHGIPSRYYFIDQPFSLNVRKGNSLPETVMETIRDTNSPILCKDFAIQLLLDIYFPYKDNALDKHDIRKKIIEIFNGLKHLSEVLKKYSPIDEVRLSDNFNISFEKGDNNVTVQNLYFEFYINNKWFSFADLSDGTKRIFYIISETFNFLSESMTLFSLPSTIKKIIFIEEPELGIHPHQFKNLMDYINEHSKSKNSQIIITTHSPHALNVLESDELHRIIIAFHSEEGTKLRHLKKSEEDKAKTYLQEIYLSDYWVYSDLEI